jgi:sugar phosphate isomerase/epimerase
MQRALSTYVFVKQRLHPGLLDVAVRGGAEAIEIFAAKGHFDYTDRGIVREIANWCRDNQVGINSLHSPMFSDYDWGRSGAPGIDVVSNDKRRRIESMDEIKRAIEVAELLPFRFLIQHLGTAGESFDSKKFDFAMTAVEHLKAFARPLGVTVLVENIPNELSTPEKLVELIRTAHFNDVGICFDLGHAHMADGVRAAFELMKPHIRSTHVHDNKGDKDTHLWPGDGTIDWDEAIAGLRTAPHVPPLVLEIEGDPEAKVNVTQRAAQTFGKFDAVKAAT